MFPRFRARAYISCNLLYVHIFFVLAVETVVNYFQVVEISNLLFDSS